MFARVRVVGMQQMSASRRVCASWTAAAVCALCAAAAPASAASAVTFSPTTVTFPSTLAGGTQIASTTATNNTTGRVQVFDSVEPVAPFATADADPNGNPRPGACAYTNIDGPVHVELSPGASCHLYYSFSPDKAGPASTTAKISVQPDGGRASTLSLPLRGTAVAPAIALSTSTLDFGTITILPPDAVTRTVQVTNTNSGNLVVMPTPIDGSSPMSVSGGPLVSGGCWGDGVAIVLGPQQSCAVSYDFYPTKAATTTVAAEVGVYLTPDEDAGSTFAIHPGEFGPDATAKVTLKGAGINPTIAPSTRTVDFGATTIERTDVPSQDVTVTNTSTSNVVVLPTPIKPTSSPFDYDGSSPFEGGCWDSQSAPRATQGRVLGPGQSCTISYGYAPVTAGAQSATSVVDAYLEPFETPGRVVTIDQSAIGADASTKITLKGTARKPTIALRPTTTDFGISTINPPNPVDRTVDVVNTSDTKLAVVPAAPKPNDQFDLGFELVNNGSCAESGGDLGAYNAVVLAPGDSCTVPYFFLPTKAAMSSATSVISAYLEPDQLAGSTVLIEPSQVAADVTATETLKGRGVKPQVSMTPSPLDFGTQTIQSQTPVRRAVTVKNLGSSNLAVLPAGLTPANGEFDLGDATLDGDDCWQRDGADSVAVVLGPGASCTLNVNFLPLAAGAKTGKVTLNLYTEPDQSPGDVVTFDPAALPKPDSAATLQLKGNAIAPTVTLPSRTLDFGSVAVSTQDGQGIEVTNTSDINVQVAPGAIAPTTAPFIAISGLAGFEAPDTCWHDGSFQTAVVLAPGATCKLYYEFDPPSAGAKSATATIDILSDPNGGAGTAQPLASSTPTATVKLALKGTGVAGGNNTSARR
jgi:hypothetical protein